MSTLKNRIITVVIGVLVVMVFVTANIMLTCMNKGYQKRINEQSKIITRQGAVIDSLLQRREKFIDVQLYVTDKSSNFAPRKSLGRGATTRAEKGRDSAIKIPLPYPLTKKSKKHEENHR